MRDPVPRLHHVLRLVSSRARDFDDPETAIRVAIRFLAAEHGLSVRVYREPRVPADAARDHLEGLRQAIDRLVSEAAGDDDVPF